MNQRILSIGVLLIIIGLNGCSGQSSDIYSMTGSEFPEKEKVHKTEKEWKAELDPFVYHVTREKGTERAFTGKYWDHKEEGTYICTNCRLPLFDSETKFKSGSGWPSYYKAVNEVNVEEQVDKALGMKRVEILCARCGSHLGHVFNDGPKPTGLRYCVNSASLEFKPK